MDVDVWPSSVDLLFGIQPKPSASWPAEFTHAFVAVLPDDEPDVDLPPEPPAPKPDPFLEDVLQKVVDAGPQPVRRLAQTLGISKSVLDRALRRLSERGLLTRADKGTARGRGHSRGWVAADGSDSNGLPPGFVTGFPVALRVGAPP